MEDPSSLNDLNELLSNIFSLTKNKEHYYTIGHSLHPTHLLLIGYFQHFVSEMGEERTPKSLDLIISKVHSGYLDLEIPINQCFLKLSWDGRQVFDQILVGFLDRLSEILFGVACKQVLLLKEGLQIIIAEPLGPSTKIVNSIKPNRYNFIQLKNLLIPKESHALTDQITNLLIRDIGFSLEEISTHLNKSKRSIQRELKSKETNFLAIKEGTRKLLLKGYLNKGIKKIDELADLLAYSERSAFEKAYKKWYGKNISEKFKA